MKTKLIINADDYGISHEVNSAISICFEKHYINQTTIMMNMPYVDEAVELSKKNGFSDKIGLHLNLVEGIPLTDGIKKTVFCDNTGKFVNKAMNTPRYRIALDRETSRSVYNEIEAQIQAFLNLGIGIRHIDSHQHSHVNPSVLKLLLPLLEKYEFSDIRLSRNLPYTEIHGFKKILKDSMNRRILKYNAKHSQRNVVAFGSMKDVTATESINGIAEMMVHPIMQDGNLKEAFYDTNLPEWWKTNDYKYELI